MFNKQLSQRGNESLMKRTCFDPNIEEMPLSKLDEIQEKCLRQTVRHVYRNSLFYRKKLKKEGIKPDDVEKASDLSKLPSTTKDGFMENCPYGMLSTPISRIHTVLFTTGTTGKSVAVFLTRKDLENAVDSLCRGYYFVGMRAGDIAQVMRLSHVF